jgi:hypothetical protein
MKPPINCPLRFGGLIPKECPCEHVESCPLNEEAKPKKIDVVETMDKIERRESLEEGKKP